jgi:hypothetical protein
VCSSQGYCQAKPKPKVHLPEVVLPANTISQDELQYVDPPPREVIHPRQTQKNKLGSRMRQIENVHQHVNRKQNTDRAPVIHRNNLVQQSHIHHQSSHTTRVVSTRNLLDLNSIVSKEPRKLFQNRLDVLSSQRGQNFSPKTISLSTSPRTTRIPVTPFFSQKTTNKPAQRHFAASVAPFFSRKTTAKAAQRQFTAIPAVPRDREIIRRRVLTQKSPASDRLLPASDSFQTVFLPTEKSASSNTHQPLKTQFTPIPAVPNFQNLDYDLSDYPEIDRDSRNNDYDIQETVDDEQDYYDYYDYDISAKEILKKSTQTVFTDDNNKNKYLVQKLFSHKNQQKISNNQKPEQSQILSDSHTKRTNPRKTLIGLPVKFNVPQQNSRQSHQRQPPISNPPSRAPQPEAKDPGVSQGCLYDCVYECVAIEQLEAYKACVKFCGDTCD